MEPKLNRAIYEISKNKITICNILIYHTSLQLHKNNYSTFWSIFSAKKEFLRIDSSELWKLFSLILKFDEFTSSCYMSCVLIQSREKSMETEMIEKSVKIKWKCEKLSVEKENKKYEIDLMFKLIRQKHSPNYLN